MLGFVDHVVVVVVVLIDVAGEFGSNSTCVGVPNVRIEILVLVLMV